MKKLPKTVYVVLHEANTDDEYLYATTDLENIEHGEIVGTYNLIQSDVMEVTRMLRYRKTKTGAISDA